MSFDPTPNPARKTPDAGGNAPLLSEFEGDADMRELIEMFVGEMPEKVRSLESLWRTRDLEPLRRLAHQLKGAGGGYGFSAVSSAAARLEDRLKAVMGPDETIPETTLTGLQTEVSDLINLCQRVRTAA